MNIGNTGMEVIGFVTQAVAENLPEDFRGEDSILVYLPLSYMIGGYTLFLPRSCLTPLDLSFEEGMKLVLTGVVSRDSPGTRTGPKSEAESQS